MPPHYRWLRDPVGPAEKRRQQRIRGLREGHVVDGEFYYRLLGYGARQAGFPMADRLALRLFNPSGVI